jgi:hypothetical protein
VSPPEWYWTCVPLGFAHKNLARKKTLDWFLSASETKKKSFTTSTLENSFKRAAKIFSRSRYWKLVDKSASRKTILEKISYLVLQIDFNSQRTEELTKTAK